MTLTVDGLRGHITTDLGDDALAGLLIAAYEAIDERIGPEAPGTTTESFNPGPGPLILLSLPARRVESVSEGSTALADDDYALTGLQTLRRLADGTNPSSCWRDRVTVTYRATSDIATRDRVAMALVKLDVDYQPGLQSEKVGDHTITSNTASSYPMERERILSTLTASLPLGR